MKRSRNRTKKDFAQILVASADRDTNDDTAARSY